ncbi:uncharacterized protein LOC124306117 isoform X1 [Neodiprion virginianus]|uniref:uncharacterized protein LOC124306117 isoform X1 n=1 Tax=Neodiprion virginianus TaxID=2961670 RepID=UPI001EE7610C|nr:uncharacterized protein LOC124306117 isoform X1 [Neodiprion virginianus]
MDHALCLNLFPDFSVVVVGNVLGHIKFYDNQLRLMFCCQKFGLDRITAISFHLNSRRKAPIEVTSESFVVSSTSTLDRTENSEDDVDNEEMDGEPPSDDQSRGPALEELLLPRRSKHAIEKREKFANLDSNVTISLDLAPPVNPDEDQIVLDNRVMSQKPEIIPSDYTLEQTPFIVDDFIVFTGTSRIARVETSSLKCHYISHQAAAAVTAVDTHPDRFSDFHCSIYYSLTIHVSNIFGEVTYRPNSLIAVPTQCGMHRWLQGYPSYRQYGRRYPFVRVQQPSSSGIQANSANTIFRRVDRK